MVVRSLWHEGALGSRARRPHPAGAPDGVSHGRASGPVRSGRLSGIAVGSEAREGRACSGDGGDENFAGYDRYRGQRLIDIYSLLPRWLRASVLKRLADAIPESFGYNSVAQKARWLSDLSLCEPAERYAESFSYLRFRPKHKEELFSAASRAGLEDADSTGKILELFDSERAEDIVDRMLFTDLMTRMPDHLLAIGDRMSMAHSLEARPVLSDAKIVEYAATIPAHLKLKNGELNTY